MRGFRAFFISMFVVMIFAALLPGCSTLERIGENQVFVRMAVTQATMRYIEAGDSAAEVADRKQEFISVMEYMLTLTDPTADATVDTIFRAFLQRVDWGSMTIADRALAIETVRLVQSLLSERVLKGELESDTVVVLRSIVQDAINAANYL